jgi:hypothetical protein
VDRYSLEADAVTALVFAASAVVRAHRGRVEEARGVVAAEAAAAGRSNSPPATRSAIDEDKAWAEIVAFFDKQPASPVPPWPVNEDADQPWGRRRDDVHSAVEDGGTPSTRSVEAEPEDTAPDVAAEEEGYVPPPPPPLPRISKGTAAAIMAVGFGLLMLLAPGVLDLDPDVGLTIGILSIVAGVGYLIWHMHDGPPIDDRPDDGAVV